MLPGGIAVLGAIHPFWREAVSFPTRAAIGATSALLLLAALIVAPPTRRLAPAALLVVLLWDPTGLNLSAAWSGADPRRNQAPMDLASYVEPTDAARLLASEGTVRYLGYDPALISERNGYREQLGNAAASRLLVNNRATLLGLYDAQGYNPVQVQRYVDYVTAMNGHSQDYHEANVFPAGLASPLLDLLNVRYLVVPVDAPARPDLRPLTAAHPTVYTDDQVRVLENREALPRAWLVHAARRVAPGAALPLLAGGTVDPRRTVLLEEEPPPLAIPADPAGDQAAIVTYEPDRLTLRVRSEAAGVLVLSEVYDPAWRAEVDGAPAPVLIANHALRGVPVPVGEHLVELRYDSPMLRLGLLVSGVAYGGLAALGGYWLWWRSRRRTS